MSRVVNTPCVFCGIVAGRLPAEVVDSGWSADESLVASLMAAVHTAARRIMTVLEPDGLNVVMANGEAAGQSVFHLHVHLIPRHHGDGVRDPWIASPGDPAEIAAVAQQLRIH